MKHVHEWIFNYNEYIQQWQATRRENYKELFNDYINDCVLRSKDINTLIDIIERTGGSKELINKLK